MNLVETLMGGVIFGLASMGSLQIYGSSLQATHGYAERQQQANGIDLLMDAAHQELANQSVQMALVTGMDEGSCAERIRLIAGQLSAVITGPSQVAGVVAQVTPHNELMLITAQAMGQTERRRWFSAAAYGLCGNALAVQSSNADASTSTAGIHVDRSPDRVEPAGAGDGTGPELEQGGMGTPAGGDGSATADGGLRAGP